jgi:hypothetical protein
MHAARSGYSSVGRRQNEIAFRKIDFFTASGPGVVILKNGIPEALLNRVLCQALQQRWVLEHDVLRDVGHGVSPGGPVSKEV